MMTQTMYLLFLISVLLVHQISADCQYGCYEGYYMEYCDENTGEAKCIVCPPDTYSMTDDKASSCEDCRPQCPKGQVEVQACTTITNRKCQCPTGEYEEPQVDGEGICKKCTVCGEGQEIKVECTATTNRQCSGKPTFPTKEPTEDTKTTESTTESTTPYVGTIMNRLNWVVFAIVGTVGLILYKCLYRRGPREKTQ